MKSQRMVILSATIGAVLVAASLAGCSAGSTTNTVTTLNWWTRVGATQKQLAADFNTSHKDIKIKITQISDDQYVNKVGTGVKSSNGPDVLDFDDANAPLFGATRILTDITSRVDKLTFKSSLNPGMMKLGTYDKKNFSVPFNAGPSILLYNKSLFEKAGLPDRAPADWAEIMKDAQAVRALGSDIYGFDIPGSCGGCLSYSAQPLMWAGGDQTMTAANKDQKTTYSTSSAVKKTFEFYRQLWHSGVVNPKGQTEAGATWGADFDAGKVGIILAGSWLIAPAEKAGYKIGYGVIPGENGSFSTFAGGDNIGISSGSKKQDAAWAFVSWLLEKKQQIPWAAAQSVPVRSDVVNADFKKKYPVAALQITASTKSNSPDSIATNALQLSATSPWVAAFQGIVYEGRDPSTVLVKTDSDSKALIKQAYEQVVQ